MNMDEIPSEQELISLLGEKIYKYYFEICQNTISLLSPDLEIWNEAGRRGKYFHGYHISKKSITVDLYLSSKYEQITCDFHFIKRDFIKILKQRNFLINEQLQKEIDFSIKFSEEYGGGYPLGVIVRDEETFKDVLQIIKIVSPANNAVKSK